MSIPDKTTEKRCENCRKELYGRTDKRFCNDGCRNQFNRTKMLREQQKAHENLPEIFKIIRRNYEILKSFGPIEANSGFFSDKGSLKAEGINTKYFTSIYMEGDVLWKFCFERGWLEHEDGGWVIQDRMEQVDVR